MFFTTTKSQIHSVLQWLQGTDETQWQDQTDLLQESLSELHRIANPQPERSKPTSRGAQTPAGGPESEKARKAIPYVRQTLYEMGRRDRAKAVEACSAAVAALE